MFTSDKAMPSEKISRRNLDQLRNSIEAWEIMGEAASQNGETEMAEMHAEDVVDLRKILRLIEIGALDQAVEAIYDLDTMASDQIPDAIYNTIVQGD